MRTRQRRPVLLYSVVPAAQPSASVILSVSHAAKHHRLPQPGRPERLPLPAGRHGGPPVHAAAGEGGADGRNGGSQRPARGTARRGPCFPSHARASQSFSVMPKTSFLFFSFFKFVCLFHTSF